MNGIIFLCGVGLIHPQQKSFRKNSLDVNYKYTEPVKREMSANALSFDAKIAKVVAEIRDIILIDLDACPVHENKITDDLTLMLMKWTNDADINRCLGCGVNMGECNPRQYCQKTYCPNQNN